MLLLGIGAPSPGPRCYIRASALSQYAALGFGDRVLVLFKPLLCAPEGGDPVLGSLAPGGHGGAKELSRCAILPTVLIDC